MLKNYSKSYKWLDLRSNEKGTGHIYKMYKELMFGDISSFLFNYSDKERDMFHMAIGNKKVLSYLKFLSTIIAHKPSVFSIGKNLKILLDNTKLDDMHESDFHLPTQRKCGSSVIIKLPQSEQYSTFEIEEIVISRAKFNDPLQTINVLNTFTEMNKNTLSKNIHPKNLKSVITDGIRRQEEVIKSEIENSVEYWVVAIIGTLQGKNILIQANTEVITGESIFKMKDRIVNSFCNGELKEFVGKSISASIFEEISRSLLIAINCLIYWQNKDSGANLDISNLKEELEEIEQILKTKRINGKKLNISKKQKYSKRKKEIEIEINESTRIKFFDAEPISQNKKKDNDNTPTRGKKMSITRGYWRKKPYHDKMEYIKPYISGSLEPDASLYKSIKDLEKNP